MKYFILFICILIITFFVYKKLRLKQTFKEKQVDEYFFKDIKHLKDSSKRKLWIHLPSDMNSRDPSERGLTNKINSDYLLICIKSIIDKCANEYEIILFDDSNFNSLLPDTYVDLSKISGSLREHYRYISFLSILHKYGGVFLPCSLFLRKSFSHIDVPKTFFVSQLPNQGLSSSDDKYIYSLKIMGSTKENPILGDFINKYKDIVKKDSTNETIYFTEELLRKMNIPSIDPKMIGTKSKKDELILLDHLMQDQYIELNEKHIGIYIPHNELLRRTNYNWFIYLNKEDVLESQIFLSKYMLTYSSK